MYWDGSRSSVSGGVESEPEPEPEPEPDMPAEPEPPFGSDADDGPMQPEDTDDLFPPSQPTPPAEDVMPAPAEPPSPQPDGGFDDLFGGNGADEPAMPAETPAPAEPAPPAAPAEDAGDGLDDLFGETTDEPPAPADEPASDGLGDLFGGDAADEPAMPSEPAPAETAPPEEPAPAEPAGEEPESTDDPFDNLFGEVETPAEPVRRWIDDTGHYETVGRLVEVGIDSVRIFKSNGRYTTVPRHRLSSHDLIYVDATQIRVARQRAAEGEIVADERSATPQPGDTAGLSGR